MLEIFAMIVILILVSAGIWLLVLIGSYPGNYARSVGHPQAEAINCMAWVGLLTAGILWFAAVIWSRVNYSNSSSVNSIATHLEEPQS